ncbi:MAG: hypothetical protein IJ568_07030 [Bacilli bacterium]|nr:hypothetical protein [Bacilli bacterium]
MNVIFLDIDGVLNTFHFGLKDYKNKYGGYLIIDPKKVEILKEICTITNAKIVLSTGWKFILGDKLKPLDKDGKYLLEVFQEHDIPLIGKTITISKDLGEGKKTKYWKEYEIMDYLKKHREVSHFCIIDDETNGLESLLDYLVKTDDYQDFEEEEGITLKHIKSINKVLKRDFHS